MIYLGIDPGLASTGYGIVQTNGSTVTILDFGCIRTSAGQETPERLSFIFRGLNSVIRQWSPEGAAVEEAFSLPQMPRAALVLGEVRGVILLAAVEAGLRVTQLSARSVKQALTGSGAADKDQVERALRNQTGWTGPIKPSHASDALAIAVVGASRSSSAVGER